MTDTDDTHPIDVYVQQLQQLALGRSRDNLLELVRRRFEPQLDNVSDDVVLDLADKWIRAGVLNLPCPR